MEAIESRKRNYKSKTIFGKIILLSLTLFFCFSSSVQAQKKGVYHQITKGVTLYRLSLAYKVSVAKIMEANNLLTPSALKEGQKIFIPGAQKVLQVEPSLPLSSVQKKELELSLEAEEVSLPQNKIEKEKPPWHGKELDIIWPIQGKINSPFGPRGKKFHNGIDIASPSYQEVKAAMDGEVILARHSSKGYGHVVVLRHDLGYITIYGHLNVIIAREGETVRQGQAIGGVGSTGKSTGPHLHFEIRHDGRPIDPLPLLPMTIEDLLQKTAERK